MSTRMWNWSPDWDKEMGPVLYYPKGEDPEVWGRVGMWVGRNQSLGLFVIRTVTDGYIGLGDLQWVVEEIR